jgi:Na+-transporting methylmalonyl-CoA/oxaloacetate decarboxylase gamma subunit
MAFAWSEAVRVAVVGFAGVFIILFILEVSLGLISRLVHKFSPKSIEKKEDKKP